MPMKPRMKWRYQEAVPLLRLPVAASLVRTIANAPIVVLVLALAPTVMTVKIVAAEALLEAEEEAHLSADEVIKGLLVDLK